MLPTLLPTSLLATWQAILFLDLLSLSCIYWNKLFVFHAVFYSVEIYWLEIGPRKRRIFAERVLLTARVLAIVSKHSPKAAPNFAAFRKDRSSIQPVSNWLIRGFETPASAANDRKVKPFANRVKRISLPNVILFECFRDLLDAPFQAGHRIWKLPQPFEFEGVRDSSEHTLGLG